MQTLDEIVELYLKMDTNYALMITGEWGKGKTYYYKNVLESKIKQTSILKDNKKKYRPIFISLFGLKSIEEIQSEIFLNLYPLVKDFKLSASIIKVLLKGILLLKGLGEFNKVIEDIEKVKVDKALFIDFEELVICFDDLERISPNLKLDEFIGFINSLVENGNIKILIITNEEKIDAKNYSVLKEKVIGNTIEFIQDLNESFNNIVNVKFLSYPKYKQFLIENEENILETFSQKSQNLRTLIYSLNYFQQVYSEINNQLFQENNLKERQTEILQNLLKFTIAISIEYRIGEITFKKRNNIDLNYIQDWSRFLNNSTSLNLHSTTKSESDKTYREIFINTYFKNDNFIFYKSIYDYLTGGAKFTYQKLLDELNLIYHIDENQIPPHYVVFNRLGYQSCFLISNAEYIENTKQMVEFAINGVYDISDYLTIFHFATRFGNPINYKIDKLELQLIRGMNKGMINEKYKDILDSYLDIGTDSEYKINLTRIKQAALEIRNKIISKKKTEEANLYEKVCYSDFKLFYKNVTDNNQAYLADPFFSKFNEYKFYTFFLKSENYQKREILSFFMSRYPDFPSPKLKLDLEFLTKLKSRVEKKNKSLNGKNVNGYLFLEFERSIQLTIDKLNRV